MSLRMHTLLLVRGLSLERLVIWPTVGAGSQMDENDRRHEARQGDT